MVFPEQTANPKILQQISNQTGAKVGSPLIADGSTPSYQAMIMKNVESIVSGLKQGQ
jgi:zinc/manganese transport system substrate-binding protein